jgi:hypothetical protein
MQAAQYSKILDLRKSSRYLSFVPLPVAFVEVSFGMPSKQCRGCGICTVEVLSENHFKIRLKQLNPKPNKALASLHTLTPEMIQLRIRQSSLTSCTLDKQFREGVFKLSESLILELPEVCYLPDATRSTELLSGEYPVFGDRDCIVIIMKVRF